MQYAEMIILWGANVLENRQGTEVNAHLIEAARRGNQIVVIDPRRSRSAHKPAPAGYPAVPGPTPR